MAEKPRVRVKAQSKADVLKGAAEKVKKPRVRVKAGSAPSASAPNKPVGRASPSAVGRPVQASPVGGGPDKTPTKTATGGPRNAVDKPKPTGVATKPDSKNIDLGKGEYKDVTPKSGGVGSRIGRFARGAVGRAGAIGAGIAVMVALADSEKSPRGTGGPKAEEARKAKAELAATEDPKTNTGGIKTESKSKPKSSTPKKKAGNWDDGMDLNKLTKAGVKAKDMNKMSKDELKKTYKEKAKD